MDPELRQYLQVVVLLLLVVAVAAATIVVVLVGPLWAIAAGAVTLFIAGRLLTHLGAWDGLHSSGDEPQRPPSP